MTLVSSLTWKSPSPALPVLHSRLRLPAATSDKAVTPSPGVELHPTLSPTATPPMTSHCTEPTMNPTSDSTDEAHGVQEAPNAPRNRSTRPATLPPSCCQRLCPGGTVCEADPSELPPLQVSATAQLLLPQALPWPQLPACSRQWDVEGGGSATISPRCHPPAQPRVATILDKTSCLGALQRGLAPAQPNPADVPSSPCLTYGVSPLHPAWG